MQPAIAWLVPSPPKLPMSFMRNPMATQYLRNVCYCWPCSFFGFYSVVLGWFSSQSYSLRLLRSLWRGFKTIFLLWALVIMGHTHLTLALVGKLPPLIVLISSCSAFRVLCLIPFQVFIRYQSLPPPNTNGHMPSSLSGTIAAPFTGVSTHLYSPIAREGNTHSMTTLIK